ncbi:hypothetical protein [Flavobacterium sp.]|uniref:hypothetical protein n=1 Tax=Flavobacterium sp. TaxID=239 RepID=UPI003D6B034E
MKNLLLWTSIITILSIACTNDSATEIEFEKINYQKASTSKADKSNVPIVDQNSLKIAINTLIDQFYDQSNFSAISLYSINQVIHPTANPTIILYAGNLNLSKSSIASIRSIANQSPSTLNLNVENSAMSSTAKSSLSIFVKHMMQFSNGDYDGILASIESYECEISSSPYYTEEDKAIMLTITSIANSSLFCERKRKDKDWETAVGNKPEDFIPTDEATFRTVRLALLSGIIE